MALMSGLIATPTIYALASAPGKAGVAVVRISGPNARGVMDFFDMGELDRRRATMRTLHHKDAVIDQALCLWFPGPHSFTGEDVLELHLHGSRAVLRLLFDALARIPGLRLAEPGEFARRAFLNGKFDLTQAEGLADLIDAETRSQHVQALRQMGGEASQRLTILRNAVLEPLALLEAFIDFPDEEIPPSVVSDTQSRVAALRAQIIDLLDDGHIGEKIREGLEITIIGPPNAGKSTLINILTKRELAIVSEEPGTTRDLIEAHLELDGYAVTLIDTAGLREAPGKVEAEGVRRAEARARQADFRLCLLESNAALQQYNEIKHLIDVNTLIFINKIDQNPAPTLPIESYGISLKTGEGLEELVGLLKHRVAGLMEGRPAPLITRARHRESLLLAQEALERFSLDGALELACEELRTASREIGKITGKIATDELLGLIFSRFCIGK